MKDRHARSPCYNDRCLFMTSIDPLPNPSDVVFEGKLKTMEDQVHKFSLLNQPTDPFLDTFSYMFAVDNDPLTCWNSFKVPQAGDSFGLRFVKPTALKYWTITSGKALTSLEGQITVLASDHRGVHWVRIPFCICFQSLVSLLFFPNKPNELFMVGNRRYALTRRDTLSRTP